MNTFCVVYRNLDSFTAKTKLKITFIQITI